MIKIQTKTKTKQNPRVKPNNNKTQKYRTKQNNKIQNKTRLEDQTYYHMDANFPR